jgi:hypothetical protein
MNAKSKSSRRTWRDPDDAPEITDEFRDANLKIDQPVVC